MPAPKGRLAWSKATETLMTRLELAWFISKQRPVCLQQSDQRTCVGKGHSAHKVRMKLKGDG